MMDEKLTQQIQQWLMTPREERDVPAGASLLLQLNRNNFLYSRILLRPERMHDKLEYELNKHLRIRLDGMTVHDVAELDRQLIPAVAQLLETSPHAPTTTAEDAANSSTDAAKKGLRPDHDTLPEEIQQLYTVNGLLYQKMKQLFEQLKEMEGAQPCDRFEYLQQLRGLDVRYRQNWETYDAFRFEAPTGESPAPNPAKEVAAARKFISTNKPRLAAALEASDDETATALREEMQQRIALILRADGGFAPKFRTELEELGLSF